ncbi:MAG: non-canonical purine NTP pyrophosphatase, partial [Balneolaceae bacterium]
QPRGEKGFGYDPVFLPDGFNRTFAELNAEEKNRISHRGRALQKLIGFLEDEPE